MALGALIIKVRQGVTDDELVEQIKENSCRQFFIGLEAFQYSSPFDSSMMVYFQKRLPESVINDCNERIVRHGLNLIRSVESVDDNDPVNGSGLAIESDQGEQSKQPSAN